MLGGGTLHGFAHITPTCAFGAPCTRMARLQLIKDSLYVPEWTAETCPVLDDVQNQMESILGTLQDKRWLPDASDVKSATLHNAEIRDLLMEVYFESVASH